MKIAKYLHSCLLVEDQGINILIDPGSYTYEEKVLNLDSIKKLDYLLITHEHFDHMNVPFIKEIINKFPNANIVSNSSVRNLLNKEGLEVEIKGNDIISLEEVSHEKIVGMEVPLNVQFNLFGKLSDPGDSHSFTKSLEILALPIQAPWGSYTRAIEKVLETKPKVVIPIHDWHWKDEVRKQMYKRSGEFLKKYGIEFKTVETGEVIDIY